VQGIPVVEDTEVTKDDAANMSHWISSGTDVKSVNLEEYSSSNSKAV